MRGRRRDTSLQSVVVKAERIDRAAYRDQHPDVATRVNNIGGVLKDQGDLDGARQMITEAFRIFVTSVGPRALGTTTVAGNLSVFGIDAIALARGIAGDPVAEELRQAMAERASTPRTPGTARPC